MPLALPSSLTTEQIAARFWAFRHQFPPELDIYKNMITSLPELPDNLTRLAILHTPKLQTLPSLPSTLNDLIIMECPELTELPQLPEGLSTLVVRGCPQIQLGTMPSSLQSLTVQDCQGLSELPDLPAGLQHLLIVNNGELTRLPQLPTSPVTLILGECPALVGRVHLPAAQLSGLRMLQVSNCPGISRLIDFGGSIIRIE